MNPLKSNSRDISPKSKLASSFNNSSQLKSSNAEGITTTKIPSKIDNKNRFNNYINYNRNISPSNISQKKTPTQSKDRPSSKLSKNSTNSTTKNYSKNFNNVNSTSINNSKNDIKREKSIGSTSVNKKTVKPLSSNLNSVSTNNAYPFKKVISSGTTSKPSFGSSANNNTLLKKYEALQNKKSISPIRNNNISNNILKKNTNSFKQTRNTSKEILRESNNSNTPKSNDSTTNSNYSSNKNKSPIKYNLSNSTTNKSPIQRVNKFKTNSTIKSKLDFREMNTSPLLINKKFQTNKSKINNSNTKTSINSNTPNIKNSSLASSQNRNLSHDKISNKHSSVSKEKINNSPQNINYNNMPVESSNNNKICKYINKVYEISRIGYQGPGVKKHNQDNYFIFENFLNNPDSIYLAVCDGHGINGHDVSKFLRENLPNEVNKEWINSINKGITLNKSQRQKLIEDSFIKVNKSVINNLESDTNFSGSTCVSLIYNTDSLICANVGDSRCVVGRQTKENGKFILINVKYITILSEWTHFDLSRDHKPNEPDELKRILEAGGRVEPYQDEIGNPIGPHRVWLGNEDLPGLAMSRSFGDEVAASVGVTAFPEILEANYTDKDKFIILASDGLWEFIESHEVRNFYLSLYIFIYHM